MERFNRVVVPDLDDLSDRDRAEWLALEGRVGTDTTFRGRYAHVDEAASVWGAWTSLPAGATVRVLDIAGGVLTFGSPTAHDLHDRITGLGLVPDIVVVDDDIPSIKKDPREGHGIRYARSLTEVDGGPFDMVRLLRVLEWIDLPTYDELRAGGIERLREGGLFVATQELPHNRHPRGFGTTLEFHRRCAAHGPDRRRGWGSPDPAHFWAWNPGATKVMQLRAGELVALALLPEVSLDKVRMQPEGRVVRDMLSEWGVAQSWLNRYSVAAVSHECAEVLLRDGLLQAEGWDPFADLLPRQAEASGWAGRGRYAATSGDVVAGRRLDGEAQAVHLDHAHAGADGLR